MLLVPGQVKCICTIDPANALLDRCRNLMLFFRCHFQMAVFWCQTELILFLKSKGIRAMTRKWFTTTVVSMACNALPITRSRWLFITNISKRKLKEEKKQPAMSRNKRAASEAAHSHELMHIWHGSAVISSRPVLAPIHTAAEPNPKSLPLQLWQKPLHQNLPFFLPRTLGFLPFQTNLCLKSITIKFMPFPCSSDTQSICPGTSWQGGGTWGWIEHQEGPNPHCFQASSAIWYVPLGKKDTNTNLWGFSETFRVFLWKWFSTHVHGVTNKTSFKWLFSQLW